MMSDDPEKFKALCKADHLYRQVDAINRHTEKGTYFFDYGNAFLLEASRAGADILKPDGEFRYPSYVQDIMGPLVLITDLVRSGGYAVQMILLILKSLIRLLLRLLTDLMKDSPDEIRQQMADNIHWIKEAGKNRLVVGSQARILYADAEGRIAIADAFNKAVGNGKNFCSRCHWQRSS